MFQQDDRAMTKINEQYFKVALADAGMSLCELARKMGKDHSGISLMFRGRREMRMTEAADIARLLNLPLTDVLKNAGMPLGEGEQPVEVIGFVDGDGEAHMLEADERYPVALPENLPPCSALVCRTSMSPLELMDGWTVYFEQPRPPSADHLNRWAVVKVKNGPTLLRHLRRGYRPDTYNLLAEKGPTIADASLEWAAAVLLIRP